jgi:hypothetical protein
MSDPASTTSAEATSEQPKPQDSQSKKTDELPDWARQQISSANQEAAQFRVQLREAQQARQTLEEQVSTLKTEKSQAVSSYTSTQTDFDKLVTAVKTLVPDKPVFAFAKTLQGGSEDELAAHATELQSMFGLTSGPSAAVDKSQGLGNGSPKHDPASEFASFLNSKLSR